MEEIQLLGIEILQQLQGGEIMTLLGSTKKQIEVQHPDPLKTSPY
jgi:hypothetical protein